MYSIRIHAEWRETRVCAAFLLIPGLVVCLAGWSADPPGMDMARFEKVGKGQLFETVLELNKIQEPELDQAAARAAFEGLLLKLRPELAKAGTPREKIAVLNKLLLADRDVAYLSNKDWRDATLVASLLRAQGNCLSTSTLYVVVGDALDLPLRMVDFPGHAIARWDDGHTRINIETTAKGKEMDDESYYGRLGRPPVDDIESLGWGRSLEIKGFFAQLMMITAGHRLGQNRLEDAMALMKVAEALSPGRSDWALERYRTMADLTGRRREAHARIQQMLVSEGTCTGVKTSALLYLADDAAGVNNPMLERQYLLSAFKVAPKTQQAAVLQALAFCHRALKDFRGAVRYMELSVALEDPQDPLLASALYNLAILQKNDKRLDDALQSIRRALVINPESWNLQMLEAGYSVLNGEKEKGLRLFAKISPPRADVEFWESMQAWFFAVSGQKEAFFKQFERALSLARGTHILDWVEEDVDLDVYRQEPLFSEILEKHRKRLLGDLGGKSSEIPGAK